MSNRTLSGLDLSAGADRAEQKMLETANQDFTESEEDLGLAFRELEEFLNARAKNSTQETSATAKVLRGLASVIRKFMEGDGGNFDRLMDFSSNPANAGELEDTRRREDRLTYEADQRDREIAGLNEDNAKLKRERDQFERDLNMANGKIDQLNGQITSRDNMPNPLKDDVDRLQGRVDQLETENGNLREAKAAVERALEALKADVEAVADDRSKWNSFLEKHLSHRFNDEGQWIAGQSGTAPEPAPNNTKSDAATATPVQTTATPAASKSKPGPIKRFRESFKKEN